MSCIPDIKVTKAMYSLYQQGYSLAEVGRAFGVSRQTVYKRLERQGYPLRQRVKLLPFVIFQGVKYTRRKNGYYASTNGKRKFLHRVVWALHNGPIPPEFDVHHLDMDKSNNHIDNLELISKSEHASKYPGRQNQYTVAGTK